MDQTKESINVLTPKHNEENAGNVEVTYSSTNDHTFIVKKNQI